MRRIKIPKKSLLIILFLIVLLATSIAYAVLKQNVRIEGKASLRIQEEPSNGYIVTYRIVNTWYTNYKYYYQIQMNLLNNTDTLLDGWRISIKAPAEATIMNFFDVKCVLKEASIEFENVSYNAQIPSKASTSFEFQVATSDPYYTPSDIIVNGSDTNPPQEPPVEETKQAEITFKEDNMWDNGTEYSHQYTIKVKNTGNSIINFWEFDVVFKKETNVEQIWNAVAFSQDKLRYTFRNSEYNGIIQPNEEVSFGCIMRNTTKNLKLQAININLK